MPKALLFGIGLHQLAKLLRTAGEPKVAKRLGVDGEDRHRRAVLGRHVPDRRPVLERDLGDAWPVTFDELAYDAVAAEKLGDGEHEVGRRRALRELTSKTQSDHGRHEHRDRLAEHRRLRLDASHSPGEHAESVHHRRVRVGAYDRIGVSGAVGVGEYDTAQVLEVELVADARARRHDAHVRESLLTPAQEAIALRVARVLQGSVGLQGIPAAVDVGNDRVVDHEVDRDNGIDLAGSATELFDCVAHGREVDDTGHSREILQEDPRRKVGNLPAACAGVIPGQGFDIAREHAGAVLVPQQVLQQKLDRIGDLPEVSYALQG